MQYNHPPVLLGHGPQEVAQLGHHGAAGVLAGRRAELRYGRVLVVQQLHTQSQSEDTSRKAAAMTFQIHRKLTLGLSFSQKVHVTDQVAEHVDPGVAAVECHDVTL